MALSSANAEWLEGVLAIFDTDKCKDRELCMIVVELDDIDPADQML